MTLYNRPKVCYTPDLQPEWMISLICIFIGCICITTTIILLVSSSWDRNVIPYARWVGFTSMILFCLAAVIFPLGFHMDEIGGQAYQLPNTYKIGNSYILFVLALWITVISELFAGKVCLPHFWIKNSISLIILQDLIKMFVCLNVAFIIVNFYITGDLTEFSSCDKNENRPYSTPEF